MALKAREWSVSGLSVELKMDRRTLGKRLEGLDPVRINGRSSLYMMSDVVEHMAGQSELLDLAQEQAKLNAARREKVELETAVIKKELCSFEEVELLWAEQITNAKTKLLALPHKAAHQVIAASDFIEAQNILQQLVDESLNELSGSGTADTDSK